MSTNNNIQSGQGQAIFPPNSNPLQKGHMSGRGTVRQESPSCLSQCILGIWSGIKALFLWLARIFCCYSPKTHTPTNQPIARPTQNLPQPQPTPPPQPQPAPQPTPRPQPQPAPQPTPRPQLHLPPQSPLSEPWPRPQPTPLLQPAPMPTPPPAIVDTPIYPPLAELIEQQKEIDFQFYTQSQEKATLPPAPETFPLLEAAKVVFAPRTIPSHVLQRVEGRYLEETINLGKQIIKGDCQNASVDIKQGIEHPCQLEEVIQFCKQRIRKFNESLVANQRKPIDEEQIQGEFKDVSQIVKTWEALAEQLEKPFFDKSTLEFLKNILSDIPDTFTDYPSIVEKIKYIVEMMARKPIYISQSDRALLVEINQLIVSKLGMANYSLLASYEIFNAQIVQYEREIKEPINRLMCPPATSDEEARKYQDVDLKQIAQIFNYQEKLIAELNVSLENFIKEHPELQVESQPVQLDKDFQNLRIAGLLLDDLHLNELEVEDIIATLTDIDEHLPDKDDPVWSRCPLIRLAMSNAYRSLVLEGIQKHSFNVHNEEHQVNEATIRSLFIRIGGKLDCEIPEFQKEMDTSQDEKKAKLQRQSIYQQLAIEVQTTYQQYSTDVNLANMAIVFVTDLIVSRCNGKSISEKLSEAQEALDLMTDRALATQIGAELERRIL